MNENLPSFANRPEKIRDDVVRIRPICCYNDFVALIQLELETSIALPTDSYKNEGIVVGVGPGLSDGNGGRLAPQCNLGDVVVFSSKNVIQNLESSSEPYLGKKIILLSERNIFCRSRTKINWELLEQ